jgi:serine/threonine-protein kinase RsbW
VTLSETNRPYTDVILTIPASTRHVRFARIVAAGMAAELGFDVDAVEDVRIAVDELCFVLIDSRSISESITLTYRGADGELMVEGLSQLRDGTDPMAAPAHPELSKEILEAVVDEHDVRAENGVQSFRFTKRNAVG